MDNTDQKIIDILKEDGRASYTDVAERVGVSEGTVRNRVERLQEEDIIDKFTVDVKESGNVTAFVSVNVSSSREFGEILEDIPENLEIYEIAGDIDIFVKLSCKDSEEINDLVDEIRAIEGVENTKTYMVLSENP